MLGVLVLAGVGGTFSVVHGAERDAGAPTWKFPVAAKSVPPAAPAAGSLRALLLPFGDGYDDYAQGPDIRGHGSDAEFNAAQVDALNKESLKDLPSGVRKQLEKELDKQRVQGAAVRSYAPTYRWDNSSYYAASVTLTRMADAGAPRTLSNRFASFMSAADVLRKGPSIEGHKEAHCFRAPATKDEDALDAVYCTAAVGDILVEIRSTGTNPLDMETFTALAKAQLDRIGERGEAA